MKKFYEDSIISEGYREIVYFISEKDREWFWENGDVSILAEKRNYPDEGYVWKWEEIFIPENEKDTTLEKVMDDETTYNYAIVAEVAHCELCRGEEEWEVAATSGGRWVSYKRVNGKWMREE